MNSSVEYREFESIYSTEMQPCDWILELEIVTNAKVIEKLVEQALIGRRHDDHVVTAWIDPTVRFRKTLKEMNLEARRRFREPVRFHRIIRSSFASSKPHHHSENPGD